MKGASLRAAMGVRRQVEAELDVVQELLDDIDKKHERLPGAICTAHQKAFNPTLLMSRGSTPYLLP